MAARRLTRRDAPGASSSAPAPPQQESKTRQSQLTIIPYHPDAAKRKAVRRNRQVADASQTQSEASEEGTTALVQTDAAYPRPPHLERIPSSRSWDPFHALAVLYVSKEERFILNYAYTTSWAVWGDKSTGTNKFAQAWMWRSMESSAAFYAQIVGAASHYQISRRETPISSQRLADVRLQAKVKALARLRSEIDQYHKSSSSIPFNSLIMAIFALAVHDNVDLYSPDESHPSSQLAKIRDMNVYGRVVFGDEHMSALYRLIEQSGGLGQLDANAFGDVVPLLDMMYAARTQTPPRLPCSRSLKPLRVSTVWVPDVEAETFLKLAGSSFQKTSILQLSDKLSTLLAVLAELSAALDHGQRVGLGVFKDAHTLLGNCDWVAHGLLSLPSFLSKGDGSSSDTGTEEALPSPPSLNSILCEICRLGALLYIDMVVYPTPPQAGVKNQLSRTLLPLLQTLEATPPWEEDASVGNLIFWGAMMGAISAKSTELQDTYIKFLAESGTNKALGWEDIEPMLQRFLWLNAVFNEPAQQTWLQVQEMASSPDGEELPTA